MARSDHDRFFWDGRGSHTVPAGKLPCEVGVDDRSWFEIDRAPAGSFERPVGMNGRWWVNRAAERRQELQTARARGDWHRSMEDQLARLKVRIEALERDARINQPQAKDSTK